MSQAPGNVTLHLGDCLEVMRGMDAGSADCVVTDPPYGIGESQRKVLSRENMARPIDYGDFRWDFARASDDSIAELKRVSEEQVIFGGNYYTDILPPSASWIVWD